MSSIKRILIFLTVFTAFYTQTTAQDQDKQLSKDLMAIAEDAMVNTKAYDIARDQMALAADADTTNLRANYEAGQLYLMTINKSAGAKYLLRVYRNDPGYRFDIEYKIGKCYQYGLDFKKAVEFFTLYKDKLATKSNYQGKDKVDIATIERSLQECKNGMLYTANPKPFSIVNIGREINSEFEDYGPVFSEKEDYIVFTSRRRDDNTNQNVDEDNKPFEDIFFAQKSGPNWGFASNIGPVVNTLYHESSLAMSADGNTLFIYNDVNGGDILYCERSADGTWGEPIPLPGIINSSFTESSISISKDENTLYFTSNRPGGYGKSDIYKATKDSKGAWSNVKNLGPKINTDHNEDGPFIDFSNVLYFSSDGHSDGMGGYDLFMAKWNAELADWDEPENLGYPINTPDDDVYFSTSADGKRAYYSSVRDEGMGFTDVYIITASEPIRDVKLTEAKEPVVAEVKPDPVKEPVVEEPKPDTIAIVKNDPPKQDPPKQDPPKQDPPKQDPPKKDPVKTPEPVKSIPLKYVVTVVDAETKSPVNAKISLRGQKDNIVVGSTSLGAGQTEFNITNKTAKDYRLSVELDGYVFQNQSVRINGAGTEEKTVTRTIELRKLAVGVTSVLRNIYFDYDKVKFKTESYTELNKLEAMLRGSNVKVEISGHTDAYGKWDYNKQLSQRRAEAVKDYLTKKGIDPRRVKAVGYGETKPLVSNDDEDEGREINRRVEFKVLQN